MFIAACFIIDDETADEFREAVRTRYGKEAWGKIKSELEGSMKKRAEELKKETTSEPKQEA